MNGSESRIVMVSGRFRHWLPSGELDREAMEREREDEQWWADFVVNEGFSCIPLIWAFRRFEGVLSDDEVILMTCALVGRRRPGYDHILMRDGWDEDPISEGSMAEYKAAEERGVVVCYTMHGADALAEYFASLRAEETTA